VSPELSFQLRKNLFGTILLLSGESRPSLEADSGPSEHFFEHAPGPVFGILKGVHIGPLFVKD
jgi:hypothetical protein